MQIKEGMIVKAKGQIGKVLRIDDTTYSIPLVIIIITEGRHKGEKLAVTEQEVVKR